MQEYKKLRKKYGYKSLYHMDELFKELHPRKARVTLEKGRIGKVESHLTNVVIFGDSLVRNFDELNNFTNIEYKTKFLDRMETIYVDFLQMDLIGQMLEFDKWLMDKGIICIPYMNSQNRWQANATLISERKK